MKKPRPSKPKPSRTTHTLFVRKFPRELTRQVNAAAVLLEVPAGEMVALLVRAGLRMLPVSTTEQTAEALAGLDTMRKAAREAGFKL